MKQIAESFIRETANEVEARVGKVGQKTVILSQVGMRYESVGLSRGEVVIPSQSRDINFKARRKEHIHQAGKNEGKLLYPEAPEPEKPVYQPGLAIISHHLGVESEYGLYSLYEETIFDSTASKEYVLTQQDNGLWRAYDAWGQTESGRDAKTYFLDASRPITTEAQGLAIRALFVTFDRALNAQVQSATEQRAGSVPQIPISPSLRLTA